MPSTTFLDEITLDQLESDPYPIYARLRAEAPVAWIPAADVWFVTRWQDCSDVGNQKFGFVAAAGHPTLDRVFNRPNVLTSDGEEHTDLRTGIDPRLKPDSVSSIIDSIVRPVARRRLDTIAELGHAELMATYFEPVSVEALRHVMGLDAIVDADTLRRWFAGLNTGIANFGIDPALFADADDISREIDDTLAPLIAELSAHPDDSMISHMLWAGVRDGRPRTIDTSMPSLKVILLGGMQEPGHAAGSTLLGLFTRPEQLARVAADPAELAAMAVNEGLRWIAPIGAIERQASVDTEVAGVHIPAGAIVEAVIASANRDETRYEDPDTFDLDRATRSHQAFGAGDHFCAGHFFARQVERIMFEELLGRLPTLRQPEGSEVEVSGWFFRAPTVLDAEWDAARPPRDTVVLPLGTRSLAVSAIARETDDVLALELRAPDGSDLPEWTPGAHIDLWAVPHRGGQYSLLGEPDDRSVWKIGVLREEQSRGVSRTVHERFAVGDSVPVGGPRNNFPLVEADRYLFLAGGIGITPLLPMVDAVERVGRPWSLHWASRGTNGPFESRLAGREAVHRYSTETARLDLGAVMLEALPGTVVYCCGPERMLDEVERLAADLGLDVHVERFSGVEAVREGDRPFELEIASTGERLTVPADRSALSVLQERGVQVLTACGEGNCGSCETRVLAGAIEHRDVLLTPSQRAAGDRMMVCVSRAAGDRVVIDL
jgi:cytochrome P450/ferredoxin-NADP reductase